MSIPNCPVIAIDGPTASGKGTVAALVAGRLGYHYLDSGAIYRVLAVAVERAALNPDLPVDLLRIIPMAANLPVQFRDDRILLGGVDVSESIRTEDAGVMASRLAVVPEVRAGLLQRQRDFRQAPGLVADGRDMGSVVFPDSFLKVFLTASAQVRAERRVRQIEGRGPISRNFAAPQAAEACSEAEPARRGPKRVVSSSTSS